MYFGTAMICLVLAYSAGTADAHRSINSSSPKLPEIARQTMKLYFSENAPDRISPSQFADSLAVPGEFAKPRGVFVTLSCQGKTRACWGTLEPEYKNVVTATVYTTIAALTKDYRYRPVKASEYAQLSPQVTVVEDFYAIKSLAGQNPLQDGLLVRSGGKSGVILPGETRDAFYQLVKCKLKAGIKPKESCQMYRIKARIYR
jgi:AMMECR1 domain-containing protein